MGSIVGGITDVVGLTDHKGAKKAQASADLAAERSYKMTTEEIAFQREQYGEWKDIYGDLQEDLGDYFKNLTGDRMATKQVEEIQIESQAIQEQLDVEFAQRGISGGGLEAEALRQNIFQTGMRKADVRSKAEELAVEKKMGFLGLGLGQGTSMLGIQAGVSSAGASTLGKTSSSYLSQATTIGESNREFMRDVAGTATGFAAASDNRLKENITLIGEVNGINFYSWDWNDKAKELNLVGKGFGVIAQEIKDVISNSVYKKDNYLAVDYSRVIDYIKDN